MKTPILQKVSLTTFALVVSLAIDARAGTSQATPQSARTPNLSPWTIAANYPLVSESVAVASDGTFAYAVGGYDAAVGPTNSFNRYDPVANTWTPLPNIPTGFYDAPAVYAANTNSIYVFGGFDTSFVVRNITQIYNITSGTWTTGAPMPDSSGRYFASGAYYPGNGKIYVIGGFDGSFTEQSQTWEYDPVANTWNTSRASIPVPMGGAGFSIVGQYIYLAGHWNGGAASTDHYRYDIVGNSWASMAPVPAPIYRPDAAAVGTNTYLVGGGNPYLPNGVDDQARKLASVRAPATSYSSTYIYDTVANTWSTGPDTNVAHSFTGGTAIGNLLIVVTGYDGSNDTNTVEIADAGGGGGIALTAKIRRQQGIRFVVLDWSPADGGSINVLRNGVVVGTTDDDGSAQDRIGTNTGMVFYQVCETDSGDCSNQVRVVVR